MQREVLAHHKEIIEVLAERPGSPIEVAYAYVRLFLEPKARYGLHQPKCLQRMIEVNAGLISDARRGVTLVPRRDISGIDLYGDIICESCQAYYMPEWEGGCEQRPQVLKINPATASLDDLRRVYFLSLKISGRR